MRKFFTIEEANQLVPMIRVEITALQRIGQDIETKMSALRQLHSETHLSSGLKDEDEIFQLECQIEFAQLEARTHIANIHQTGAELKDIQLGLVDFPAWKDGVEVLLCWRMGEDKIQYWHGRNSGYMGQMPIEE